MKTSNVSYIKRFFTKKYMRIEILKKLYFQRGGQPICMGQLMI